jgi:2-polyprenyl-3-methyl-5-hydroxy-6-metoxy-1,4-benzoquinol methylase
MHRRSRAADADGEQGLANSLHLQAAEPPRIKRPPLRRSLAYAVPFTAYPYTGRSEACSLCGSNEREIVATFDRRLKRLKTVICLGCGLLRTEPMPTDEELDAYYGAHYRFDYQLAGARPPRHHRLRAASRAQARAELLAPVLTQGARVLDFGCGAGEFLKAAAARGCKVVGIEPGAAYAACAREIEGALVIDRSWREVELPAASFDVVTAHHVLEHLRRPFEALRRLSHWLKDDGVVYASVPDVSAGANAAYERLHFAHVHGFAPATLLRAGRAAGLVPDERFAQNGTTVVLRKRRAGDPAVEERSAAPEIRAALKRVDPVPYLFGLGFLPSMIRRNLAAVRDGLRRSKA